MQIKFYKWATQEAKELIEAYKQYESANISELVKLQDELGATSVAFRGSSAVGFGFETQLTKEAAKSKGLKSKPVGTVDGDVVHAPDNSLKSGKRLATRLSELPTDYFSEYACKSTGVHNLVFDERLTMYWSVAGFTCDVIYFKVPFSDNSKVSIPETFEEIKQSEFVAAFEK